MTVGGTMNKEYIIILGLWMLVFISQTILWTFGLVESNTSYDILWSSIVICLILIVTRTIVDTF